MTISNESAERRDLWWVKGLDSKVRPALVVSNDFYNSNPRNSQIMVVPLTSLKPTSRLREDEVLIEPSESGLRKPSLTKLTKMQPVNRSQLVGWIDCVSEKVMEQVDDCIRFRFGLRN